MTEIVQKTESQGIKPDEYGKKHGLYTREWLEFIEKGEKLPILNEIMRVPEMRDTYNFIIAVLMADEEVHLPPLDMIRAALHTMRELKLIAYELEHDIDDLPESHPKLANAIQRAATQVDQLRREHRRKRQEGGLFEDLQKHMTRLKLEIDFTEQPIDQDVEVIEGAFSVLDDDDDGDESIESEDNQAA